MEILMKNQSEWILMTVCFLVFLQFEKGGLFPIDRGKLSKNQTEYDYRQYLWNTEDSSTSPFANRLKDHSNLPSNTTQLSRTYKTGSGPETKSVISEIFAPFRSDLRNMSKKRRMRNDHPGFQGFTLRFTLDEENEETRLAAVSNFSEQLFTATTKGKRMLLSDNGTTEAFFDQNCFTNDEKDSSSLSQAIVFDSVEKSFDFSVTNFTDLSQGSNETSFPSKLSHQESFQSLTTAKANPTVYKTEKMFYMNHPVVNYASSKDQRKLYKISSAANSAKDIFDSSPDTARKDFSASISNSVNLLPTEILDITATTGSYSFLQNVSQDYVNTPMTHTSKPSLIPNTLIKKGIILKPMFLSPAFSNTTMGSRTFRNKSDIFSNVAILENSDDDLQNNQKKTYLIPALLNDSMDDLIASASQSQLFISREEQKHATQSMEKYHSQMILFGTPLLSQTTESHELQLEDVESAKIQSFRSHWRPVTTTFFESYVSKKEESPPKIITAPPMYEAIVGASIKLYPTEPKTKEQILFTPPSSFETTYTTLSPSSRNPGTRSSINDSPAHIKTLFKPSMFNNAPEFQFKSPGIADNMEYPSNQNYHKSPIRFQPTFNSNAEKSTKFNPLLKYPEKFFKEEDRAIIEETPPPFTDYPEEPISSYLQSEEPDTFFKQKESSPITKTWKTRSPSKSNRERPTDSYLVPDHPETFFNKKERPLFSKIWETQPNSNSYTEKLAELYPQLEEPDIYLKQKERPQMFKTWETQSPSNDYREGHTDSYLLTDDLETSFKQEPSPIVKTWETRQSTNDYTEGPTDFYTESYNPKNSIKQKEKSSISKSWKSSNRNTDPSDTASGVNQRVTHTYVDGKDEAPTYFHFKGNNNHKHYDSNLSGSDESIFHRGRTKYVEFPTEASVFHKQHTSSISIEVPPSDIKASHNNKYSVSEIVGPMFNNNNYDSKSRFADTHNFRPSVKKYNNNSNVFISQKSWSEKISDNPKGSSRPEIVHPAESTEYQKQDPQDFQSSDLDSTFLGVDSRNDEKLKEERDVEEPSLHFENYNLQNASRENTSLPKTDFIPEIQVEEDLPFFLTGKAHMHNTQEDVPYGTRITTYSDEPTRLTNTLLNKTNKNANSFRIRIGIRPEESVFIKAGNSTLFRNYKKSNDTKYRESWKTEYLDQQQLTTKSPQSSVTFGHLKNKEDLIVSSDGEEHKNIFNPENKLVNENSSTPSETSGTSQITTGLSDEDYKITLEDIDRNNTKRGSMSFVYILSGSLGVAIVLCIIAMILVLKRHKVRNYRNSLFVNSVRSTPLETTGWQQRFWTNPNMSDCLCNEFCESTMCLTCTCSSCSSMTWSLGPKYSDQSRDQQWPYNRGLRKLPFSLGTGIKFTNANVRTADHPRQNIKHLDKTCKSSKDKENEMYLNKTGSTRKQCLENIEPRAQFPGISTEKQSIARGHISKYNDPTFQFPVARKIVLPKIKNLRRQNKNQQEESRSERSWLKDEDIVGTEHVKGRSRLQQFVERDSLDSRLAYYNNNAPRMHDNDLQFSKGSLQAGNCDNSGVWRGYDHLVEVLHQYHSSQLPKWRQCVGKIRKS